MNTCIQPAHSHRLRQPNLLIKTISQVRPGWFGQPVESGEACLDLTNAPKNGVVVAVEGNVRIRKCDYRIKLVEGVSGTPLYDKHYQ